MSSLSVRGSETSIEQARRGMLLTLPALLYVPLLLVTPMFSVSLRLINGSRPQWWWIVLALAVIAAVTTVVILTYQARTMPHLHSQGSEPDRDPFCLEAYKQGMRRASAMFRAKKSEDSKESAS